ncbi:MAG: FAD synthetase family protein [Spirochaetaceae bacterium]|nr:FAD synthetase family protein [Spirochaetaceae bacterium]
MVTKEFKVFTWQDILCDKFFSLDELKKLGFVGTAITIGVFDGVHLGHDVLLESVLSAKDCFSGVVTFSSNPSTVFFPEEYRGDITSMQQKLSRFKEKGLGFVVVIDFSSEFGKIEGKDFLSILKDKLSVAYIAEGQDFRCGYKGLTDMKALKDFLLPQKVIVKTVPQVMVKEQRVSSSAIRKSILKGDFSLVKELLGRSYSLDCNQFLVQYQQGSYRLFQNKEHKSFQVLPPNGRYNLRICVRQNNELLFYSVQGEVINNSLKFVFDSEELQGQCFLDSVEFAE